MEFVTSVTTEVCMKCWVYTIRGAKCGLTHQSFFGVDPAVVAGADCKSAALTGTVGSTPTYPMFYFPFSSGKLK